MRDKLKPRLNRFREKYRGRITFWRRAVTLLISVVILSFYFRRVDWHELRAALANVNLGLFLVPRLMQVLLYLFVDVYLLQRLLVWFHRPISYSKVLYGRASLYLFSLINPQLANGGMFLYLMRKAEVSWRKLLGLVIFRVLCSVWSLNFGVSLVLAATFLLKLDYNSAVSMRLILGIVFALWASLVLAWAAVYLLDRQRPELRQNELWGVFFQARPRHYLTIAFFTLLTGAGGVVSSYFCALSFGIKIPVHEMMILLPIADIISTLPIAFMGLGTTTFAWHTLWRPYGTGEQFLSFTIAFPVATYLMRTVIALIALPRASREIQAAFARQPNPGDTGKIDNQP